jgi:hypothetical protein
MASTTTGAEQCLTTPAIPAPTTTGTSPFLPLENNRFHAKILLNSCLKIAQKDAIDINDSVNLSGRTTKFIYFIIFINIEEQ